MFLARRFLNKHRIYGIHGIPTIANIHRILDNNNLSILQSSKKRDAVAESKARRFQG